MFTKEDFGKFILRLTLGILMLFHGVEKIINPESLGFIKLQLANVGWPEVLAYGVYIGEVVAPLMIILGILARLGGVVVVVNMIFAVVLIHANELISLGEHGGWALELQGFYLLCGLVIVFLGSGRIAAKPD